MAKLIFVGDRVVIHKKDVFRLYDGFALNTKDMEEVKNSGKKEILFILHMKTKEEAYLVTVDNWLKKSITHDNHGELQFVLRRKFFDRVIKAEEPKKPEDVQQSLKVD